jgi:hypothetical protein
MHQSDTNSGSGTGEGVSQPLPLFRAEAIASQQQKLYGEILLIRPLSLTFLGWLGVAIAASVLGFLLLGETTEKIRVSGILSPKQDTATQPEPQVEVDLYVPGRFINFVKRGERLLVRCRDAACEPQTATVKQISTTAIIPAEIPEPANLSIQEPLYRVVVTVSPLTSLVKTNEPLPAKTKVEAEVPLGRKSLIKWLFERRGA